MVSAIACWLSMPSELLPEEILAWVNCVDLPRLAAADRAAQAMLNESFWRSRLRNFEQQQMSLEDMRTSDSNLSVLRHQLAILEARASLPSQHRMQLDYHLHMAAHSKSPCWPLLLAGASWCSEVNGKTPLVQAIMSGHEEAVHVLIACGADAVSPDQQGDTPLILAIAHGHVTMLKALVLAGASTETADGNGDTPLINAVVQGSAEAVQILVDLGADVEARDQDGDTPLICAVVNGQAQVVELLLRAGADVHEADCDGGDTPLFRALEDDCVEVLEALIAGGANLKTRNREGETPLDFAIRHGHSRSVQVLEEACIAG
mmetsp:Transcript_31069/g.79162  ORF Transcript_31069/g.79162 Transcript_31069/m.79162 type:complete len:319 (-) Transcript_31069:750-1706(-)